MKVLMAAVLVVSMAGVAEGQDQRAEKPASPDGSLLKVPVGITHIPEALKRDALARPGSQPLNLSQTYAEALSLYSNRLKAYADAPAPASPEQEGIDCVMVHWADTTPASIPTLKPRPDVDARMPVLAADAGCAPPQTRPDEQGR